MEVAPGADDEGKKNAGSIVRGRRHLGQRKEQCSLGETAGEKAREVVSLRREEINSPRRGSERRKGRRPQPKASRPRLTRRAAESSPLKKKTKASSRPPPDAKEKKKGDHCRVTPGKNSTRRPKTEINRNPVVSPREKRKTKRRS